jgi:uncharacterized protein with NAD-binding domain and iron-sulfur cluster
MSKQRVVIMGAGPAGLTAAWELTRQSVEVVVWEADPVYGRWDFPDGRNRRFPF